MNIIWTVILCVVFASLGSCAADRDTFQDCAKTGSAYMQGVGWIDCTVRKQGGLK